MSQQENGKFLVLDVNENPRKIHEWILFPIQHILAMLVACITVPLLTRLPIAPTIVSAGLGTIVYILITKRMSPVFLSSSFAYLAPMTSALSLGLLDHSGAPNYLALILGMLWVGIVYVLIAVLIKFVGTKWLNILLPPLLIGPIIMVIGLSLSGSAINNLCRNGSSDDANYNWVGIIAGLIAMFGTALSAYYGKGMISLIPFIIGMGAGYIFALIMTGIGYAADEQYLKVVSFDPFKAIFGKGNFSGASIFNYKMFKPNDSQSFIIFRFDQISEFDWSDFGQVMLLFIPVSLVTICEHIGDHTNLGLIIHKDLLNGEPGMHRTLTGDGLATALSGILCGAANTTYGENVAVIGTTKIASINVVLIAAGLSIVIGFFTPFTALLQTIPGYVTGGVSLILYGFIASSGMKMLIEKHIDFNQTKNIFVASVVLVSGIGGFSWRFGKTSDPKIIITPVAVAMVLGIILNAILREKKESESSSSDDQTEMTETPTVSVVPSSTEASTDSANSVETEQSAVSDTPSETDTEQSV